MRKFAQRLGATYPDMERDEEFIDKVEAILKGKQWNLLVPCSTRSLARKYAK